MRIQLQISDDVYDKYVAHAENFQGRSGKPIAPEELMQTHLDQFSSVSPADRIVIIHAKQRQQLEEVLSGGSLRSAEDLVDKVKNLSSVGIGNIRFNFTPGQLHELKIYAARNGIEAEEAVRRTVRSMEESFFWSMGAR